MAGTLLMVLLCPPFSPAAGPNSIAATEWVASFVCKSRGYGVLDEVELRALQLRALPHARRWAHSSEARLGAKFDSHTPRAHEFHVRHGSNFMRPRGKISLDVRSAFAFGGHTRLRQHAPS